jgi:CheY-like chemotaxis protein/anti-sigma regulatory factor (Ser/Thr protein kinase)
VTRIRQILLNLLSNAAKFTENGQVRLEAQSDGDEIVFRVSDTGIGMSEEQISRIFKPFTQADASTTRKFGGTGLGLAITRRFSELMGGRVTVESSEGDGSTFTVTLPRDTRSADGTDPADSSPGDLSPGNTGTGISAALPGGSDAPVILVIDDDPAIREVLMRSLIAEGYRPLTASTGADGMQRCRETRPDLIILDVLMPQVDGWSVLAALKADEELSDIPVVVHSVRDDRELGFMLGACDYLVKPVDRQRMLAVLQKHLGTGNELVLVVEDDDATSRAVSRLVRRHGWRVSTAGNGVEALEEMKRESPSAIVLDLMMPEMDGFTFFEELHSHPAWREIPVVVLTARDLSDDERDRLNGNVLRIVEKSGVSRDRLLDEVRRTLERAVRASERGESSPSTAGNTGTIS